MVSCCVIGLVSVQISYRLSQKVLAAEEEHGPIPFAAGQCSVGLVPAKVRCLRKHARVGPVSAEPGNAAAITESLQPVPLHADVPHLYTCMAHGGAMLNGAHSESTIERKERQGRRSAIVRGSHVAWTSPQKFSDRAAAVDGIETAVGGGAGTGPPHCIWRRDIHSCCVSALSAADTATIASTAAICCAVPPFSRGMEVLAVLRRPVQVYTIAIVQAQLY